MKKVAFWSLLLLSFSSVAQQMPDRRFSMGIRLGANYNQLTGESVGSPGAFYFDGKTDHTWGYVAALFFRRGGGTFFTQHELGLSQKGGAFTIGGTGGQVNLKNVDVRFSNIDFTNLVGVRFLKLVRVNGGIVLSYNTGNNGDLGSIASDFLQRKYSLQGQLLQAMQAQVAGQQDQFSNAFKGISVNYQAGVGVDVGRFTFDLRYEGGITDVMKTKVDLGNADWSSSVNGALSRKVSLWQITAGIGFGRAPKAYQGNF